MSRRRNWRFSANSSSTNSSSRGRRFDQRDAHARGRKHAGVFRSDHSTADDDHAARQFAEVQQVIAVDDSVRGEGDGTRPRGHGAHGDQDIFPVQAEYFVRRA